MAVMIRRATAQDYEALCKIIEEVDVLHREALPHIFRESGGPVRERVYMLGLLADEDHGLFVAEVDGQVAGFLHVTVRDAPPIPILVPRRVAVVDNIAVKKAHRRDQLLFLLPLRCTPPAVQPRRPDVFLMGFPFPNGYPVDEAG